MQNDLANYEITEFIPSTSGEELQFLKQDWPAIVFYREAVKNTVFKQIGEKTKLLKRAS